jgi:hypothetical protein
MWEAVACRLDDCHAVGAAHRPRRRECNRTSRLASRFGCVQTYPQVSLLRGCGPNTGGGQRFGPVLAASAAASCCRASDSRPWECGRNQGRMDQAAVGIIAATAGTVRDGKTAVDMATQFETAGSLFRLMQELRGPFDRARRGRWQGGRLRASLAPRSCASRPPSPADRRTLPRPSKRRTCAGSTRSPASTPRVGSDAFCSCHRGDSAGCQ